MHSLWKVLYHEGANRQGCSCIVTQWVSTTLRMSLARVEFFCPFPPPTRKFQTCTAPTEILEILHSWTSNPPPATTQLAPAPLRTVSAPNPHQPLCVWKTLKIHAACFIASANLFSGSFQSQQKLLKKNSN